MAKKKKHEPLVVTKQELYIDDLTEDQKRSYREFLEWFYSPKRKRSDMIFRIGALAGCGKSALIKFICHELNFTQDDCYVVAYTGQAVNVLRQGGTMAKTIHSTFMSMTEVPLLDEEGNPIYVKGIPITKTKFKPLKKIPATIKLVICDEASFLPDDLEKLILKYNVPILEVGDPLQLPPVSGKQCFYMDNLNCFMSQIMRQNADSEIIRFATAIRRYDPINFNEYGFDVRFLWAQDTIEETFARYKPFIKQADIMVTTNNKERNILTDMYRSEILHTKSPYPIKGERLICRKNDWNTSLGVFPLTNGTQGFCLRGVRAADVDTTNHIYTMDFQPVFISNEYYDNLICDADFLKGPFGSDERDALSKYNIGKKLEFAHALTAHTVQGAQFPTVMFFDRFMKDPEYHMRIRYTVATRATDMLTWVLPITKSGKRWSDLEIGGFRPDGL